MEGFQLTNDIVVYLLGLSAVWGTLLWRVAALEKKMDKHNNAVERLAVVEQDVKSIKRRVGEIEEVLPRTAKDN
ncbi:hypothetical protein [Cloacibacillus evryensis]|uniref:hypothetical protein n=1 Tax=Cloacibacillus evryensis TaxID=508460 RepID=UPI000240E117|nr:hypothetical protein [Cloacibacillus evryensis]EHL65470.1 hypothetical protein HMPREF1006_00483 [Synergistes sp. 3_1_syn1]